MFIKKLFADKSVEIVSTITDLSFRIEKVLEQDLKSGDINLIVSTIKVI